MGDVDVVTDRLDHGRAEKTSGYVEVKRGVLDGEVLLEAGGAHDAERGVERLVFEKGKV